MMGAAPQVIVPLEPGAFYTATQVGGFEDTLTGLKFQGHKVRVDPLTREILEVVELAVPRQLPHAKIVISYERKNGRGDPQRVENEVYFDEVEDTDLTGGLFLAIQTGVLKQVPEDVMRKRFPELWEARSEHLVFRRDESPAIPMRDLLADAERKMDEARRKVRELDARPNVTRKEQSC